VLLVLCCRYCFAGTVLLVLCCWYCVAGTVGTVLLVLSCWYCVVGTVLLVLCCRYCVVGTVLLVLCCWYCVVATVLLVLCFWYYVVGTVLLVLTQNMKLTTVNRSACVLVCSDLSSKSEFPDSSLTVALLTHFFHISRPLFVKFAVESRHTVLSNICVFCANWHREGCTYF
jgi:hypothetical protein